MEFQVVKITSRSLGTGEVSNTVESTTSDRVSWAAWDTSMILGDMTRFTNLTADRFSKSVYQFFSDTRYKQERRFLSRWQLSWMNLHLGTPVITPNPDTCRGSQRTAETLDHLSGRADHEDHNNFRLLGRSLRKTSKTSLSQIASYGLVCHCAWPENVVDFSLNCDPRKVLHREK
jgi:hypothetical protein